jgi:RNA polymerase sigma-70 factor (ECF subfamily)
MKLHEKQIIKGIIQRDEKSLRQFYETYHTFIFRFISRQISDRGTVSELTQDVLFDCIEYLRDFKEECSLKTYVCTIAKNKTVDYIRKKKIKKILFSALPAYIVENAASIVMDDELEKNELAQKIADTMARLPNDYRIILRLKYIEGYKVKDIARKLTMSFKSVESMLYRARGAFIHQYKLI